MENVNGGRHEFQDTGLLSGDTAALDSPLTETQVDKLDFHTQLVEDDVDCVNDGRLCQPLMLSQYGGEVVLDSEDEGIESNPIGDKGEYATKSKKRRLSQPPRGKEYDMVSDSGVSIDQECRTGNKGCSIDYSDNGRKDPSQMTECGHETGSLNYISSQEPGELSQANALGFVDEFLTFNAVNFSPGINTKRTVNKKSSFSGAKGPQILAKKIRPGTPVGERDTFEWVDIDHHGGGEVLKGVKKSVGYGSSIRQETAGHQNGRYLTDKENSSLDDKCEKNVENLDHSCSRFVGNIHTGTRRIEQPPEMNPMQFNKELKAEALEQQLDDGLDVFEVGINTQIAAEAIETLLFAPLSGCSIGNANQGTGSLEDFPNYILMGKFHSEQHSLQKISSNNFEGSNRKLNQGICPARKYCRRDSSAAEKTANYQESDPKLAITSKAKRSKTLTVGNENARNPVNTNENSGRKSFRITEKRKAVGAVSGKNIEESENCSSSIVAEQVSRVKGQSDGKAIVLQTTSTEERFEGNKDRSDNTGKRKNDDMQNGILTYRRRLSGRKKHSKFSSGVFWQTVESKLNQQEQTVSEVNMIPSFLNLEAWNSSRRKRSSCKLQRHSVAASNLQASITVVKSSSKCKLSSFNGKKKNDFGNSPNYSTQARGSKLSGKVNCDKCLNEASFQNAFDKCHKIPYQKNIPKSSLLKELMRLGMVGTKVDSAWKDLRIRRDAAYVRVLFSQHLDDGIVKQQKKILARLGISTASCSMDATHFVADRFVRTRNMLESIALGKPVVTHLWLESCGQANCLIDEKNYILRDTKKEKEVGFSMPDSLAHANRHPLLKGKRVLVTPHIKPDKEMIVYLVKAVHGQVVERSQISMTGDQKISDDLLILSCEEDEEICFPFLDKGAAAYSSELLLNGIVVQKLEYERHQLFLADVVERRQYKKRRSRRMQ